MPAESRHHPRGDLASAVLLAAGAGVVDAFVFLRVTPTFVANMSGNLVRVGMAVGQGSWRALGAALVALVSFSAAAMAGTMALDRHLDRRGPVPRATLLFLGESVLLFAAMGLLLARDSQLHPEVQAADLPVLAFAAAAMGVQAVSLRAVGQTSVSTTYGTGALVRLSEKVALAMRRAARPADAPRRVTIAVLGIVLLSYVAGAAIGAVGGSSPLLLLGPALVPLVAARQSRNIAT